MFGEEQGVVAGPAGWELAAGDLVYSGLLHGAGVSLAIHQRDPEVPALLRLIVFETLALGQPDPLPEKDYAMSGNDYTRTLPPSAQDRLVGPVTGDDVPPEERGPSSLKPEAIAAVAAVQGVSLAAAERAIRLSNRNHNGRLASVKQACQDFYKATKVKVTLAATEVWLPTPIPTGAHTDQDFLETSDRVAHQVFVDNLQQYIQLYCRLAEKPA